MNFARLLSPAGWDTQFDLFYFFRWWLTIVCFVYALILTGRSLWGWIEFLSRPDRPVTVLRHYVIVQLLRLRVRRFRGELVRITAWTAALVLVIRAHAWIDAF